MLLRLCASFRCGDFDPKNDDRTHRIPIHQTSKRRVRRRLSVESIDFVPKLYRIFDEERVLRVCFLARDCLSETRRREDNGAAGIQSTFHVPEASRFDRVQRVS